LLLSIHLWRLNLLADQRRFSLTGDQWKAFVTALDRPAQSKPRLHRLFAESSVLEQQRY